VATAGGTADQSDGQLLERFVARGDHAAFEALLCRHGPMVYGVCRRQLPHQQDAEDAFQATFLVLAHRARSIARQESVGSWLYGVAYRTAVKAQAEAARRRTREAPLPDVPATSAVGDLAWQELCEALDEEVNRLGQRYRAPVVLCYFENKSYAEAARVLGLAAGTVASRLARARALLRRRLMRRGLALSAGLFGTLLAQNALTAAVPTALVRATLHGAGGVAAGGAAGGIISAPVAALTKGVLKTMFVTKLKILTAVVVAVGLTGTGAHMLAGAARPAADERAAEGGDKPATQAELQALRKELDEARREIARLKRQLGQGTGAEPARAMLYRGKPAAFWVEQLHDGDPSYRLEAVNVLGIVSQNDPKVIPPLLRMLNDKSDDVRIAAARSLGMAGTPAIPALVARLSQADLGYLAAQALGHMGAEAKCAVPALVEALRSTHPLTRQMAVDALGRIGPGAKEALPALVQVLKKGVENRQTVSQAIGQIDPAAGKVLPNNGAMQDVVLANNLARFAVVEPAVDAKAWKKAIQELEKKYPLKPGR
jgi:RNA polymerase sigma factor (sigma-70 family)